MAGSLPLKNDVQLVTQFPQSRRQALDVLSAAESVIVELDGLQQQQQQQQQNSNL